MPRPSGRVLVAQNRKARHDYHIGDRFEAGMFGQETGQGDGWVSRALEDVGPGREGVERGVQTGLPRRPGDKRVVGGHALQGA